jgi:hypothetical protein
MTARPPTETKKRLGLMTLAVASAALVAAAAPRMATAQPYDDDSRYSAAPPSDADLMQRMRQIHDRIDDAAANGDLTRLQASRGLDELSNIRTQAGELRRRDGDLTETDLQFIDTRLDRLEGRLGYAANMYRRRY